MMKPLLISESISTGSLQFLTELVSRLTEPNSIFSQLNSMLEFIGHSIDASRISIIFDEDWKKHPLSWSSDTYETLDSSKVVSLPLTKSGSPSRIIFEYPPDQEMDEHLLGLITLLIDSALDSHRIIQNEQSQRQFVESINQISTILTSTLDREELLSLFLDQLRTLVPYDSASVMLLQGGLLYMHAARGHEDFSGPVDISKISFVPSETYLMEEVLSGKKLAILADTKKCPQWLWTACGKHIRSWMGVPLVVKDHVIGLFSLDKTTPDFFNPRHVQLVSALSKHAALALDNALLFDEVQEAHKRLKGLSAKIIKAQEQERQKIAMELHDQSGQALIALRAELRVLQFQLPHKSAEVARQIEYLDQIVQDLSKELNQLAYDLRPPTLTALGLTSALDQYIQDFQKRMKIKTFFSHDLNKMRLPEDVELVCYRIVQEALTNLVKHARATEVEIKLIFKERTVHLTIKDDGIGIKNEKAQNKHGFGLIGIRERLTQIKGTLEIKSQAGKGTELIVAIPIK
jgi:signal transduction histidine kinase